MIVYSTITASPQDIMTCPGFSFNFKPQGRETSTDRRGRDIQVGAWETSFMFTTAKLRKIVESA
jgi:hypothetical protein